MNRDAMRRTSSEPARRQAHREPLPKQRRTALANWRDIAPALIARADRQLPLAEFWLPGLLNDLDRRFDLPLDVSDAGPVRTVTALVFVRYTIDRDARTVSSAMLAPDGPIHVRPAQFDVLCAWSGIGWLRPLLEALPAMQLVNTLLPDNLRDRVMTSLAAQIEPLVRRDERFLRLRLELRSALRFDESLFRLALRTRPDGGAKFLTGGRLTEVWQHEAHLRVVEQDAPRLLPLAYTLLDALIEAPAADAVKVLKGLLGQAGLTEVGWRYLLKFGGKGISAMGGGDLTIRQLAELAQALALAGGHPPPSPALRQAWAPRFTTIARFGADHKDSILTWLRTERRLASAILKAANEAKRTPHYGQFIDDVTSVLWWLRDAKITTPRKSLRKLIEAAKTWEADQLAIAQTGRRRWAKPRTIACPDELHEAMLLNEPAAVLEEARTMRNCLRGRLAILKTRRAQLWVVRRRASGERIALIELRRDGARWNVGEIAARFNRPAPHWVTAFAESIALCEMLKLNRTGGAER